MPKKISLIGMMGTGKSSVAAALSKELTIDLVDLDQEIEKKHARKIPEIFKIDGEDFFRKIETETLEEIASLNKDLIISCGGGAFISQENQKILLKNSKVIWLSATPETIYERIKNDNSRPLLQNDSSIKKITDILTKRINHYMLAHLNIKTDNKNIADICTEIIDKLNF